MQPEWRQRTGWPSSLIEIRHRIGAFTRGKTEGKTIFKIGITCRPERRGYEYDRNEPFYDRMIVLYETSSIKNARDMEKALIKHYRDQCDNLRNGGGGRIGTPPHYMYIVVNRS